MKIGAKSLNFKIVLYTVLCVFVVGGFGILYVYTYMNRIVTDKVEQIDELQLETMKTLVDGYFDELLDLGLVCAGNRTVETAMKYTTLKTQSAKRSAISAQDVLNVSLSATSAHRYVQKMLAFNMQGMVVQASNVRNGDTKDVETIWESAPFKEYRHKGGTPGFILTDSITPFSGQCFSAVFPVKSVSSETAAYLYLELSTDLVLDVLKPYSQLNHVFFTDTSISRSIVANGRDSELPMQLSDALEKRVASVMVGPKSYELNSKQVMDSNVLLWSVVDISDLMLSQKDMLFTLMVVLLMSPVIAVPVAFWGTRYITRPVSRLIFRLHRIAENDFSYDPTIEQSQDEIGQIGHVVNEMAQSVAHLLEDSIEAANEKKNIEIALLQAQVNPHFLYNTLDSIYWMATMAKNPNISKITRSLMNLLRNMSKGIGNKISLAQEIGLLEDYVSIQSVRYGGVFAFKNLVGPELHDFAIVKMTLQPIVENAIIHGIGGAQKIGLITLRAHTDDSFLYLEVEDNGVGMSQEQVERILHARRSGTKEHLSGIGMENVHHRLKLVYGKECGLAVESEQGVYTRVTVKIRKEKPEHV